MRIFTLLLSLCLLMPLCALPCAASASPPGLSASSAILIEAESGRVLYEKDARTRRGMASTTKIMTALVALEAGWDPETEIRIPDAACGVEGSSITLAPGETLTLSALLYALMLASANDAARAIAMAVAGNERTFVAQMNQKAASLGLADTHFENPHGLDGKTHLTTAYDLAMLTRYALENEVFRQIVSCKTKTIPGKNSTYRHLVNHNRLLREDAGVYGVKTGFTRACGRCLVSACERDGVSLIAVTLKAPNDWADHRALYDYGFSLVKRALLADTGAVRITIPVTGGTRFSVSASNSRAFSYPLTADARVEMRIEAPHFLFAPIIRGQAVGEAVFLVDGTVVGRRVLCAEEGIDAKEEKRGFFASLWDRIREIIDRILGK